jgi:hypothetical protein
MMSNNHPGPLRPSEDPAIPADPRQNHVEIARCSDPHENGGAEMTPETSEVGRYRERPAYPDASEGRNPRQGGL